MRKKSLTSLKRYHSFNIFLKNIFGERVQKVIVDAGFSCPNRDGFKGKGGCIYCNNWGSGSGAFFRGQSISTQVRKGISFMEKRYKARKFLVYFQAFSNTYAPVKILKEKYDSALIDPRIVGLCIGTRPDCVEEEKLDLLMRYQEKGLMVWLELGLQSIHDSTLKRINRGHTYKEFEKALFKAKKRNLLVCVHIIFGLPGENSQHMLATIEKLAQLPIDGIKFHELYIVKGSVIEDMYKKGEYLPLKQGEYVDLICESLASLPWRVVIQRLTGDPRPEELVSPSWALKKRETLNLIEHTLIARDLWQGKYLGEPDPLRTTKTSPVL